MDHKKPQLSQLQRALYGLKQMRSKLDAMERIKSEPIAIIGLGCRFPSASNPEAFWQLLRDGVDAITEIPPERWDVNAYYDPNPETPGKMNCRHGGFLEQVDQFDPLFFGISPREAMSLDPQQRLLLEVSWEALERAGQAPTKLINSRTGVFVGIGQNDYAKLTLDTPTDIGIYDGTGNAFCFASGRLSYVLGLQGPNMAIDTACSSSLVAIDLAITSLRRQECDLVLAGGVHLSLLPNSTIFLSSVRALSPDGRCKTFDASADGFSQSEGCGMVVLKRLSDAIADGDNILALIRGSAVNHDGPASGLTVPNELAQEKLIREALKNAGVDPQEVGYVETHGTGTKLGDPIEVGALGSVFAQREHPLLIGAVKTNFGHLGAAAGIAGLIKVVLAFQHGEIPPNLHFNEPNPYIDWDNLSLKVPTERIPFNDSYSAHKKRIAGVSSFGMSGTNAHVVLEEAPAVESADRKIKRSGHILTLSAKSEQALTDLTLQYVDFLSAHPQGQDALSNICYTANVGRCHFDHRVSVTAESIGEMQRKLAAFADGQVEVGVSQGDVPSHQAPPQIAFLFTGQGSQYVGMGRTLYETEPIFRQVIDQCHDLLQPYLSYPLLSVLYPTLTELREDPTNTYPAPLGLLDETAYTQPALFALEYALAKLWQSWGVVPDVVMGHSVGELVAACVAGVFSLEDGLRLVAERARLMQALPKNGTMTAILASESVVATAIAAYASSRGSVRLELSIAAINGPENVVISGTRQAVHEVVARLPKGIRTIPLTVSHAFHSPLMEPMLADFLEVARSVTFHPPQIKLIANARGDIATPEYWSRHVRETVRFAEGMQNLHQLGGVSTFVEIGPKPTLLGMGRQVRGGDNVWLPSLRPDAEWSTLLATVAQLYVQGVEIDWAGFYRDNRHNKIVLPTYPFQRERYWVEPVKRKKISRVRPLLDKMMKSPLHKTTIFETEFSVESLPFLADHRVYDAVVSPAACQLGMVLSAAEVLFGSANCVLEDVIFPQALVVPEEGACTVQAHFTETARDEKKFQLISFSADDDTPAEQVLTHATGQVMTQPKTAPQTISLDHWRSNCPTELAISSIYQATAKQQIVFGPTFRWLSRVWVGDGQSIAKLERPRAVSSLQGYLLHPGLLDACLQTAGASLQEPNETMLPFAIRRIQVHQKVEGQTWWCVTQQTGKNKWDIYLLDKNGELLVELLDFEVRAASREALQLAPGWQDWLYTVSWQARPHFGLLPDYLLAPQQLNDALAAVNAQVAQLDWPRLIQAEEQLERLSQAYVLSALTKLGFVWRPGLRLRSEQIMTQLAIVPSYKRLLERLLSMLAEAGILKQDETWWRVVRQPAQAEFPVVASKAPAAVALLTRCGEKLAEVLRGTQEPLELLFPSGDASLVEALYRDAPTSRLMNQLVLQAVQTALEQLPDGQGIRILEVGAGTGGTTSTLLPHLPAERTDYLFTDIGRAFLIQAQEKFSEYDFVEYKLLDIEQEPTSQGFASQQYDLVIAANVLHATQELSQTLSHIQQLLKPNGALLLLENTTRQKWVDLTFGLTEGWWRFSDVDIRPDHPLLTAKQWQEVLLHSGFQAVTYLPEENVTHPPLGGTLLYAQASRSKACPEGQGNAQQWLLLADEAGNAEALGAKLRARGEQPLLVWPGNEYEQLNEHTFKINPHDSSDYQHLLQAIPNLAGVVHLWSLDQRPILSTADLERAAHQNCGTTLLLVQSILQTCASPPALWLVTQGAQAVVEQDQVNGYQQAALWGMGRTIAQEHPELNCVCLDLDPLRRIPVGQMPHNAQSDLLCAEIMTTSPTRYEAQVALRQGRRYVARLSRYQDNQEENVPTEPFRLEMTERGTLDNMQLRPVARRAPARGEVEIRVRATGLNFRDVLKALDLYPGAYDPLGNECAGDIVAVGEGVEEFTIGDPVIVMASGCFSQYLTVNQEMIFHKPKNLTYQEAAGIPIVFLTAIYSLHQVAQIKPNDRVLIHAASGGVGQAAIQIAQQAGANVFGTASPGKWEALASLGVKHLYNSRTLDFAAQIMADTDGQGVDIVLNSLTGEGFIEKSLSVLAPNGRFVEIAKRDIQSADEISALRPDVSYQIVDLGQEKLQIRHLLKEVLSQFERGTLKPLPHTEFAIEDVVKAFRYMQQAKHIGKIVVTQKQPVTIHHNGTYLITGGLGGLGLKVADWLIHEGARHLMLMGRSQPTPEIQAKLEKLTQSGAEVIVVQADVSNSTQVSQALAQIDAAHPLRGIIHSVGVLDDGAVTNLSWQRFMKVLAPKMCGAWNLHQLTRHAGMARKVPLDFFVLFSSMAGIFGSRGQANHAAANTFLDAFAHYRMSQNLPALSIAWGAWSEIGAAAEIVRSGHFDTQGGGIIEPEQGIEVFAHLLDKRAPLVAVSPINWNLFLSQMQKDKRANISANASFFEEFALLPQEAENAVVEPVEPISFRKKLTQALTLSERGTIVSNILRGMVSTIGGFTDSQLDNQQSLLSLGLDSLMAIELRNNATQAFEITIPISMFLDGGSIASLATYIIDHLEETSTPQPAATINLMGAERSNEDVAALEELSEQGQKTYHKIEGEL